MPIPANRMLQAMTKHVGVPRPPTARPSTVPLPGVRPATARPHTTLPETKVQYRPQEALIQKREPITTPLPPTQLARPLRLSSPATLGGAALGGGAAAVGIHAGFAGDQAARQGSIAPRAPAPVRPLVQSVQDGYVDARTNAAKAVRDRLGLQTAPGGPQMVDEAYSTPDGSPERQSALIDPQIAAEYQRRDFYARPAY